MNNPLAKYYGAYGNYLAEHQAYLDLDRLRVELRFIKKVLDLRPEKNILDIACGQGRHLVALLREGYSVDGVDFSAHMINLARKEAGRFHLPDCFFVQDVQGLHLPKQYDKAFWIFADFGNINLKRAIESIVARLKIDGTGLIDSDSVYRLQRFLTHHPDEQFIFNQPTGELIDSHSDTGDVYVPYLTLPQWSALFSATGCTITGKWGDYDENDFDQNSARLIMRFKKVK